MNIHTLGAIPNFLGEGYAEAMEQQCISLFVAVALEKDPVKRFALKMSRDNLLVKLSRHRDDKAEAARHVRRSQSKCAANSPRRASKTTTVHGADASCEEMSWYCQAQEADPLRMAIDTLAQRCVAESIKCGRDCRDIFAAALYHFAILLDKDRSLPSAKLINRSVAWAYHHLMREDYAEHNARERRRDGDDYQKWTWRLMDDVVEATFPGLRKALRADIASAIADAAALYEDLHD